MPKPAQAITARFTEAEIAEATVLLRERIAALEAENARLRAAILPSIPHQLGGAPPA